MLYSRLKQGRGINQLSPPRACAPCTGIVAALALAAAVGLHGPRAAGEEVKAWINPEGGAFEQPDNWSPPGVPGADDVIVFDLGGSYAVSVSSRQDALGLLIGTDDVRLDLNAILVLLRDSDAPAGGPSVVVGGTAGDVARLEIGGGWPLTGHSAAIGRVPGSSGEVVLTDSSPWRLHGGTLAVAGSETAAGGTGILTLDEGRVFDASVLQIWPGGSVNLNAGRLEVSEVVAGGAFNFSGGALSVQDFHGDLVNMGGVLRTSPRRVGLAGDAKIHGSYTQADGALEITILDQRRYDHFDISDHLQLSGMLDVRADWSALLRPGDSFDILSWGTISGEFESYSLPDLDDALWSWDTSDLTNTGTLRILGPEKHWTNSAGGAFDDAENWSPPDVPEYSHTVHFDVGSAYSVQFAQDHESVHMLVHDDDVTLSLNDFTYAAENVVVGTHAGTDGRLTLLPGTLSGRSGIIGRDEGSHGEVTVGAGVVWESGVRVGRDGTGRLQIIDGGIVTGGSGGIGSGSSALVSGQESQWAAYPPDSPHGAVSIDGLLQIMDGGEVIALREAAVSEGGQVNIKGEGSLLHVFDSAFGRIRVGGTLNVLEGATARGNNLDVGSADGGTGTVNVVAGSLSVGGADGDISVFAGSTLNILDGASAFSEYVNRFITAGGQINVAGSGSTLRTHCLFLDSGQLDIADGATVEGELIRLSDGGWIAVRGSASVLAADSIFVGAGGLVEVSGGGGIRSNVTVAGGGAVVIRDSESQLEDLSFPMMRVGNDSGTAHLSILSGASARIFPSLHIGPQTNGSGVVEVSGDGSHLESGSIVVGRTESNPEDTGGGTLMIGPGATLQVRLAMNVGYRGRVEIEGPHAHIRELALNGGQMALTPGGGTMLEVAPVDTWPGVSEEPLSIDTGAGSWIDLSDNRMIVREGDLPRIHAWVAEGYAGGAWDGPGIQSSVAAAQNGRALGVAPDGDDVLVRFTWAGDATLDGRVDGEDFLIWQANFSLASGAMWHKADFNYDGRADGEDFLIWQANFGNTADTFAAVTPEPAAASLLLALRALFIRRRR